MLKDIRKVIWIVVNSFDAEYRNFLRYIHFFNSLSPEVAASQSRRALYMYLQHCRDYSPYWKDNWPKEARHFTEEEADDVLQLLPILTKQDLHTLLPYLRIPEDICRSLNRCPSRYKQTIIRSGGSTGIPSEIYVDSVLAARSRATRDYLYRLCGLHPGELFFFIGVHPTSILTRNKTSERRSQCGCVELIGYQHFH